MTDYANSQHGKNWLMRFCYIEWLYWLSKW